MCLGFQIGAKFTFSEGPKKFNLGVVRFTAFGSEMTTNKYKQ